MLDKIIEEAIATWKPIEFKREDLDEKRFKVIWWTSLEIEKEINRLWDMGYVPIWGLACTYTSHWLVYAQLMENLYYNPITDETQMGGENSWQDILWDTDWEWELSGTWESETNGWDEVIDGTSEVWEW